jgi:A/G-specific adenine glycosylase
MSTSLAVPLLKWYQDHARWLPWREHPTPYIVWISEVMLQQTRVETVIPYYELWMENFPTLASLAHASQQEVLTVWEGLGYYSRARNLHRAAQIVMDEFGGKIPQDVRDLQRLPGIGRYTAGAIASIAFGKDEPALDGNIRRVLARVFDVHQPARSRVGEKHLWELANTQLPPGQAGEYNQALMDLGALICTPRQPNCTECPLIKSCRAYDLGVQDERPVKLTKEPIPHFNVSSAIIQQNGQVLIAQRPPRGLLGGLWEFPGGKVQPGEDLVSALKREIREELDIEIEVGAAYGVYQHTYKHFRITLHAFLCTLHGGQPQGNFHTKLAWINPQSLKNYPMGKIDRQISNALLNPKETFLSDS